MTDVTVLVGDCLASLRTLPDQSVHTCVTSPPYFNLRNYGVDGQIGLEDTPDAFVARLVEVFREVRRVLRDDGTLFLNLGDSYFSGGARRAGPCGTSGKAPEGCPESDCLCGSLCDACQRAYHLGKSHSGARHAPRLGASTPASSPVHKGSHSGHLPTSGSALPGDRTAAAIPDPAPSSSRADGRPLDAPVSTTAVSSQPPQAEPPLSDQPSECLSCGRSLQRYALASVHKAACNCGTSEPASGLHNSGMGAWGSAYPYSTTKSLKAKDLIGIPWRVAFALQADGWYLRQDIIWAKPNPMPESVRDRCTKAHEYVFLLSKGPRYYFDSEAIKEPMAESSIPRLRQNVAAQAGSARANGGAKTNGTMKAVGNGETRNRRSVWTVTTKPFKGAHFATFPPDLIEPCILAGCPVGGTVLDPFGGSGTTAGVALKHGRNAILCEMNPDYAALVKARVDSIAGRQETLL